MAISNISWPEAFKILVKGTWKILKIQREYLEFIARYERDNNSSFSEIFFDYHSMLIRDSRLPKKLLPDDRAGQKAYQLYLEITKKLKSQLKNKLN